MEKVQEQGAGSAMGWSAGLVAAGVAAWVAWDYARWRSLGPGGLPATFAGWLTMTRFRLMAKHGLDVGPLLAEVGAAHDLRAWTDVRRRSGARPAISPYPVPHRQLDQLPDDPVRLQLAELFDRAVQRHRDRVEYSRSHFEKRHPAVTLKVPAGTLGARSCGEIAHIHPSDHSMHMILSPGDTVAAIQNGWAERHGLAGIAAGLPLTYVMVYAPRNQEDLTIVGELLEAAIAYGAQAG